MSIQSIKENGVYIEDPQKAKEIKDALNSYESAFADIEPEIKVFKGVAGKFAIGYNTQPEGFVLNMKDRSCILLIDATAIDLKKFNFDEFSYVEINGNKFVREKSKKKKQKTEQLPGQLDIFNIIDKENDND